MDIFVKNHVPYIFRLITNMDVNNVWQINVKKLSLRSTTKKKWNSQK